MSDCGGLVWSDPILALAHSCQTFLTERHPVLRYGDRPVVEGSRGLPFSLVDIVDGLLNPLTKSGLSLTLRLSLSSASPSPPGK